MHGLLYVYKMAQPHQGLVHHYSVHQCQVTLHVYPIPIINHIKRAVNSKRKLIKAYLASDPDALHVNDGRTHVEHQGLYLHSITKKDQFQILLHKTLRSGGFYWD